MTALLETNQLRVTFGGLRAVDDLDLRVEAGQLVGLIGPNGAGKTTTIDALTGFVPATGTISFDGAPVGRLAAHRRARRGLARTWQSLELFDDLTIVENLLVASDQASLADVFLDLIVPNRKPDETAAVHALNVLGIADLRDRMPTEISQGQRKLVGVARALAAVPKLVCMDEPAAGLDTRESVELGERLRTVVDSGVTILLVDHDMGLVLNVCDYIYVIEFGRKIAEGTPSEIIKDERVIEAYLGSSHTEHNQPEAAGDERGTT